MIYLDMIRKDGHRSPGGSVAVRLAGDRLELCLSHCGGGAPAAGQFAMHRAEEIASVIVGDRSQRADDDAGACGQKTTAEAKRLRRRRHAQRFRTRRGRRRKRRTSSMQSASR